MNPFVFLAFALGAVAVVILWITAAIEKADNWSSSLPDAHGDYPAVPDDLIEEARAFHEATLPEVKP
jgi:hypothetical protein